MQLDDFGRLHETRRHAGEVHHQRSAYREVGGPHTALACFLEVGIERVQRRGWKTTGATDDVQTHGNRRLQDLRRRVAGGEVDEDVRVLAEPLELLVCVRAAK